MIQVRKWLEKQLRSKMAAECQVLSTRDDVRWRLVARDAHNTRALCGRGERNGTGTCGPLIVFEPSRAFWQAFRWKEGGAETRKIIYNQRENS